MVIYKNTSNEERNFFLRSVFTSENEANYESENVKIISEGKENIAIVNDNKIGILATFGRDKILAIEEDKIVSLLDDTIEIDNDLEEELDEITSPEIQEEVIANSLDKYIINVKGENIKIALIDSGVNTENTGNYLDANGLFPSNASKQELRNLTHFYFKK